MKRLLSEPYVHFLIIGLLLYLLYSVVGQNGVQPEKKRVSINSFQQEKIKKDFFQRWQRVPNDVELEFLYKEYFRQEVMLDEAVAMQLEKKDKVVRDRLLDRMDKVLASSVSQAEPDEEELQEYYRTHKDSYRIGGKIIFFHIFADKKREAVLSELLDTLWQYDISPRKGIEFGDTFSGSSRIGPADEKTLSAKFGNYFAGRVRLMPRGEWSGPVRSKYGVHLVYIIEKTGGEILPFDEVEELVYRDFIRERQIRGLRDAYDRLVSRYRLEVN
ncbi:MAG: hypothetical protein B5M52_00120 [Helicobacteraceae bacterium 4484_230]|nr:MAG: hypothetical protein B5M52_00120 [Helicobacteraceae bacterium 4484_230]